MLIYKAGPPGFKCAFTYALFSQFEYNPAVFSSSVLFDLPAGNEPKHGRYIWCVAFCLLN